MSELHPCLACAKAPCCQNLPLEIVDPETRQDFDDLLGLLAFPELEVVLKADGSWNVFYRSVCRFLNPATNLCTIHDTDRQPQICKDYSAQTCWYRWAFVPAAGSSLRFDRARLTWFADQCVFDLSGRLHRAPDWEAVQQHFDRHLPLKQSPARTQSFPTALANPKLAALQSATNTSRAAFLSNQFKTASNRDFALFRTGFPGVSLVLADGQTWFEVELTGSTPLPARWQMPAAQPRQRFADPDALRAFLNSSAGPVPDSRPEPAGPQQTRLQ